MNSLLIGRADDFTRAHPVLVGVRHGTTLTERLERIRNTARKASVRDMAIRYLEELMYGMPAL